MKSPVERENEDYLHPADDDDEGGRTIASIPDFEIPAGVPSPLGSEPSPLPSPRSRPSSAIATRSASAQDARPPVSRTAVFGPVSAQSLRERGHERQATLAYEPPLSRDQIIVGADAIGYEATLAVGPGAFDILRSPGGMFDLRSGRNADGSSEHGAIGQALADALAHQGAHPACPQPSSSSAPFDPPPPSWGGPPPGSPPYYPAWPQQTQPHPQPYAHPAQNGQFQPSSGAPFGGPMPHSPGAGSQNYHQMHVQPNQAMQAQAAPAGRLVSGQMLALAVVTLVCVATFVTGLTMFLSK